MGDSRTCHARSVTCARSSRLPPVVRWLWRRIARIALLSVATVAAADGPVQLTNDGTVKRDPVWTSSEATDLVYAELERPNQLRLMRLSLNEGRVSALHPAETRSEFEPAYSLDGRWMAYVQNRGNLSLALVIHDLKNNVTSEVPPGGGFSGMRSPAFQPGQSRIVFSYPEEGRQQIYAVDLQGQHRALLVDSEGLNNWPGFSPDGQQLVFGSSRENDYEIYVANADGTRPVRLTESPRQDIRPRFSPDGSRIAFTSNRDGNYEIYVMRSDGTDVRRVTNHPEQDDFPLWHPNGSELVILSERAGAFDFYRITLP